jgi:hypothetical protein
VYTIQNSVVIEKNRNCIYFSLYGRPISKVEIAGVVVAISRRELRVTTLIDDGTGIIRCLTNFYVDEDSSHYDAICVGKTNNSNKP